jgi:ribose transport system permease protein
MNGTIGEPALTSPADRPDAPVHAAESTGRSLWRQLMGSNTAWIFVVLLVLVAIFSAMKPGNFPTEFNIRAIATNASVLLIIAVGETFVIITGGIDLSVGYVLLFSGVAAAETMAASGDPTNKGWDVILLGLLVALASGLAWGILNGFLIAKAKVPALIVTLGTLGMAWGLAEIVSNGQDVRYIPNMMAHTIGAGRFFAVPWLVIVAAVVAIAGAILLNMTKFGRYTIGIGSNQEAARRAGINVEWHLIKVYALSGLLAGLGGFLALAYFTTTTISGHANDNLNAIAAVVIGGTSLFGGVGTVIGTAIGVFIPAVLQSGFIIIGIQSFWQNVAVGAVLIGAVFVDQLRRRSRERR